ncbi:hypothetical protein HDV00_000046 [Rhizophlyctis rosea]|nr:hypothetical protein HDV00_000046 [Rhizophlyctis rosea]
MRAFNSFFVFALLLSVAGFNARADSVPIIDEDFTSGSNKGFWTYEEVSDTAQRLARGYPDLVKYESLGNSLGNRELFALSVTNQKSGDHRPSVLFTATTHGDEPLSLATLLYVLRNVVQSRDSEPVKRLLEKTRMYFVPIVNPDAWFTKDRIAVVEKNGRDTCSKDSKSSGVNLGHNYNYQWDTYLPPRENRAEQYEDGCSPDYHGPEPFSEPETVAIRDLVTRIKPKAAAFIHQRPDAGSSRLIIPYTYHAANVEMQSKLKLMHANDAAEYQAITSEMQKATDSVNYVIGTSYEVSKKTISGSEVDWAFDQANCFAVMLQVGTESGDQWVAKGKIEDVAATHLKPILQLAMMADTLKPKIGRPGKSFAKHIQTAFYIIPMILGVVLAFILMIGYVVARALGYDKIWDRFVNFVNRVKRWRMYRQYTGLNSSAKVGDGEEDDDLDLGDLELELGEELEGNESEGFSYRR